MPQSSQSLPSITSLFWLFNGPRTHLLEAACICTTRFVFFFFLIFFIFFCSLLAADYCLTIIHYTPICIVIIAAVSSPCFRQSAAVHSSICVDTIIIIMCQSLLITYYKIWDQTIVVFVIMVRMSLSLPLSLIRTEHSTALHPLQPQPRQVRGENGQERVRCMAPWPRVCHVGLS